MEIRGDIRALAVEQRKPSGPSGPWCEKVEERLSHLTSEVMGLSLQCNQMNAQGAALTEQVAQCSELTADEMSKLPESLSTIKQDIQTLGDRQTFVDKNLHILSGNVEMIGETMKALLDQFLVIKAALEDSGEEPQEEQQHGQP